MTLPGPSRTIIVEPVEEPRRRSPKPATPPPMPAEPARRPRPSKPKRKPERVPACSAMAAISRWPPL